MPLCLGLIIVAEYNNGFQHHHVTRSLGLRTAPHLAQSECDNHAFVSMLRYVMGIHKTNQCFSRLLYFDIAQCYGYIIINCLLSLWAIHIDITFIVKIYDILSVL